MTYQFASGFRLKTKPQVVGEYFEKLEKRFGRLDSKIVLEAAQKPSSPIHGEFDWDDQVAAGKWRENQAQYILRAVVAVTTNATGEPITVRAFVNVAPNDGHRSIASVYESAELTEQLLAKALSELRSWKAKYETYKELAGLCAAVEKSVLPWESKITLHKAINPPENRVRA